MDGSDEYQWSQGRRPRVKTVDYGRVRGSDVVPGATKGLEDPLLN